MKMWILFLAWCLLGMGVFAYIENSAVRAQPTALAVEKSTGADTTNQLAASTSEKQLVTDATIAPAVDEKTAEPTQGAQASEPRQPQEDAANVQGDNLAEIDQIASSQSSGDDQLDEEEEALEPEIKIGEPCTETTRQCRCGDAHYGCLTEKVCRTYCTPD